MKEKIFVAIFLITFIVLTSALEEPATTIGEANTEKIQENIDKYAPFDDNGEIDLSGYKPIKGEAEEKIAEINMWLEKNASWLKIVFGIIPSLTILFALNFYIMLFLITLLVFNGDEIFGSIGTLTKKIDIGIIKTTLANILGVVIFLTLLVTKAIVKMANIAYTQLIFFWNKILPYGAIILIITIVLIIVILILLEIYTPQVLQAIKIKRDAIKKSKSDNQESLNRKTLDTIVKKATQDT